MRRDDKEIKDFDVIQAILQEAPVCRIAMSHDDVPYIVPMNFAYHDNALYLREKKHWSS